MWKDLTDQEKTRWTVENDERESQSIEDGVARMRRAMEHIDVTTPERRRILERFDAVSKAIEADQKALLGGMAMPGRPQTWAPAYLTMDADKLAVMVLQVLTTVRDGSYRMTSLAFRVAEYVKIQHELEEVIRSNKQRSKEERGFSRSFIDRLRGDSAKVKKLFKKINEGPLKWTPTQRIGIGSRLIKIVCDCNVGWDLLLEREKSKTVYYVNPTPELLEEYAKATEDSAALATPVYKPMTCPPVDWVQNGDSIVGGYRLLRPSPIKYNGIASQHKPDLAKHDLTEVLGAVNAIQSVEWRIDCDVLVIARRMLKSNNPQWDHLVPSAGSRPRLDPIAKGASKAEIKIWRQKKEAVYSEFKEKAAKRIRVAYAIATADSLVGRPVFFVHTMDWRGRIYPCPTAISPQGTDLEKALIRYKEKVPLGPNGLEDLKIWAAGCAGMDKIPFPDRVSWWNSTWGDNPDVENDMRWTEYDDPFLFFQAAREIRSAIASGTPALYLSDLSICVDGSQNGLQHLSAMGRDEVGGEAVNLVDGDRPRDLYANVGNLVYDCVVADAALAEKTGNVVDDCGEPVPSLVWMEELENPKARRKVVKRSVLAYPYGVTKPGMRDGLIADGFTNGLQGSKHRNAWYLAERIDSSVRNVVISAARLMDWFRFMAEELGKIERPVEWVTPAGFPCRMRYLVQEDKRIEVNSMRLTIRSDTDTMDVAAQVRGVVANIVHSLDSAHLVKTCHRMLSQNYRSFQFIHDSFGCHAGRIRFLNAAIRQEFVKMHSCDITGYFHQYAKDQGVDIPAPPPVGKLNLEDVKMSRFFFA